MSVGRPPRDPVQLTGMLLVLLLVTVLPLALALVHADAAGDASGVGSGIGDVSAAALCALQTDLSGKRAGGEALPASTEHILPLFFAAPSPDPSGERAPRALSCNPCPDEPLVAPAPTGPGPDGVPLLR